MIIHEPTKIIKDGQVRVSSCFEMDSCLPNLPNDLWFSFPEEYESYISTQSDAYAPTALLMAMYAGENLEVSGAISPRLASNLVEYGIIFHTWFPNIFRKVDIHYKKFKEATQSNTEIANLSSFSGGVDSFYTLWAHLPKNLQIPDLQVTHGLFVKGLDLRLEDEENYQAAYKPYSKMFKDLDLELIQASTNGYQFSEFRINWTMFHGAPTIGAVLCLSPFFRNFYIASGLTNYNNQYPYGSAPIIDHLLSTESLHIVHHGASLTRTEKASKLIHWPTTHHKFRVCANKTGVRGLINCGKCHKCYRMIVVLDLLNANSLYNNFPSKMTLLSYIRWGLYNAFDIESAKEIKEDAISLGRIDILFWVQMAIIFYYIKSSLIKLFKLFLSKDSLYKLKREIYPPESISSETKQ